MFGNSERSAALNRNVVGLFGRKIGTIVVSLITIPLALSYIDKSEYGVYITLVSVVNWFALFDLGLGNGFRNKFTEALARKNQVLAKTYVSTAFFSMLSISVVIGVGYLILRSTVDAQGFIGATDVDKRAFEYSVDIVVIGFLAQFVLKITTIALLADQRAAESGMISFIGQIFALLALLLFSWTSEGSLINAALAMSLGPACASGAAFIYYFSGRYKNFSPRIEYYSKHYLKDIVQLGLMYFVTQVAGIVVFSTDNILISRYFGPSDVTDYYIAFKYYNVVIAAQSIINTPVWSAVTKAIQESDYQWITSIVKRLAKLWLLYVSVGVVLLLGSSYTYSFWIGDAVQPVYSLQIVMLLYMLVATWIRGYSEIINGSGKIRLSMYHAIASIVINIPLSLFFVLVIGWGPESMMMSTVICLLPQAITHPLQVRKLLANRANGIWGK